MRALAVLLLFSVFAVPCAASDAPSAPLWHRDARLTKQGEALLRELSAAADRGLRPADYRLPANATDADLSRIAAHFMSDLSRGRVSPADLGYDLGVERAQFDSRAAVSTLASAADVSLTLDAMEPQLVHYRLLRTALARYRTIAASRVGAPLPSPPPRKAMRAGDVYAGAPALRALLTALGDLSSTTPANASATLVFDQALSEGVRKFQERHGLVPDGALGRATYRALIVPLDIRVQQIELSMERIRWLPQTLDAPPIIVNVPQFRLFAFRTTSDRAQDILQMDVIVGADFPGRRTPVFAADMRYVVLQPYWDVPRSILVKEMLPQIAAHADWIERNGYEIVRGQTDASPVVPASPENLALLTQGALRLRQKPGPLNALGRIKFMLPNAHQVYLHDTPSRNLFAHSRRAFSHGCIRVADPMALLAHVMRDDATWSATKRDLALEAKGPVRVPLPHPVRVFIVYGTALATEAGPVHFFDDIYSQDAPLLARLSSGLILDR